MAESTFDICTECGEETEVWIIDDETRLCKDCLNDLDYVQCDICQEYWMYDAIAFTELPDGRTVCQYCMEDRESWDS